MKRSLARAARGVRDRWQPVPSLRAKGLTAAGWRWALRWALLALASTFAAVTARAQGDPEDGEAPPTEETPAREPPGGVRETEPAPPPASQAQVPGQRG
ncbi:MAG TPA: hypothetical protein RMF84_20200, partial [Polyangiaceae bacterium LLY-WYZ-14_1]|nr:hypothetical protein [Polyangiaceae bacterium LLY-WYZ-14_1]